jgi:ubiquinol-cytochrome c reductase iron-sulfur subunit
MERQTSNSDGKTIGTAGPEPVRRDFLYVAAASYVAVGSAFGLWPLIASMNPGADVRALASVEVDLSPIKLGQRITIAWRGKPVFIHHRGPREIEQARAVNPRSLPDPQGDEKRVKRAEWLVVVGVCTHLGCVPKGQGLTDSTGEFGGWFCPCHGSHYDTSGRIRKGPAPRNLEVPSYEFISDTRIRIG